jgi:hypothetical protein
MKQLVIRRFPEYINLLRLVSFNHILQGNRFWLFLRKELINMHREDFFVKNVTFANLILVSFVAIKRFIFVANHDRIFDKIKCFGIKVTKPSIPLVVAPQSAAVVLYHEILLSNDLSHKVGKYLYEHNPSDKIIKADLGDELYSSKYL